MIGDILNKLGQLCKLSKNYSQKIHNANQLNIYFKTFLKSMVINLLTIDFYFEQRRVDNMDKYLIPRKISNSLRVPYERR